MRANCVQIYHGPQSHDPDLRHDVDFADAFTSLVNASRRQCWQRYAVGATLKTRYCDCSGFSTPVRQQRAKSRCAYHS